MLIIFAYSFFTQDNSENVSQDQTEAGQDFEPGIDPKRVPFYKVLQLLLLFAFFLFGFGVFFISMLNQFDYPLDRYKANQFHSPVDTDTDLSEG